MGGRCRCAADAGPAAGRLAETGADTPRDPLLASGRIGWKAKFVFLRGEAMADVIERKIGDLTVGIDRELCIGSGNCVNVAPDLFELDSEGICAFAKNADGVSLQVVIEGCEVCPVEALIVTDSKGEKIVP
jgi:ferredoxin